MNCIFSEHSSNFLMFMNSSSVGLLFHGKVWNDDCAEFAGQPIKDSPSSLGS